MMKKKSRIEMAREIIANLKLGLNRPVATQSMRSSFPQATPFLPMPMAIARFKRTSSARSY
jgi:siderophore synthetase component